MEEYVKTIMLLLYGYASCEFIKTGCFTINLEGKAYGFIYPNDEKVTVNMNGDDTKPNYDHGCIDIDTMTIKGNKGEYKIEKY